jgi:hypothetical protein
MPSAEMRNWVRRKRTLGIIESAAYAFLTITGGIIFLGLTFWLVFMASKLVLLASFPLFRFASSCSVVIALVVCGIIFADSLYALRDDMSFLPGWLLREYVDIGPRLILEGYPHVARTRGFFRLDIEMCAGVLMFLASRSAPAPKRELLRIFSDVEWSRLVAELRLFPGVIFFQPDAMRVTLTLPLRLELRGLRAQGKRIRIPTPDPEPEAVPVNEPHKLSPAEILGVTSTASLSEIKLAYRRRIKECHPDRFAGMDDQSRTLAEEWTKSLNAAYESLVSRFRGEGH